MGAKSTCTGILVLALAACGGAAQTIDRLDVQLTLQKDGSLQASETWTVGSGNAASLRVDLPRRYHDGLSDTRQDAATPGTLRRQYVAAHTLSLAPGRAHLTWPVLPAGHRWRIRDVHIAVQLAEGIVTLSPAGVAEAGWTVTARPGGIEARRNEVAPGESATLLMEFSREGLSAPEPEWQFLMERAEEFKPAFMSAAGFIVVVGIAVLALLKVLVSAEAQASARRGLRVAGLVFLILGALLAGVVNLTLSTFGPWTLGVPASIAFVGAMFVVAGRGRARS